VWRPILERAGLPLDAKAILAGDPEPSDAADRELLGIMTDRSTDTGQSFLEYVPSSYHFYLGLAAIKEGDLPRARTELQAAVAFATRRPEPMISINPDIVIAMAKAVGDDAEFQALTERTITRLEQYLRNELVKYESELTGASTRQVRLEAQRLVASECNQLAWLLANTGRKLDDAVELSERSLLLAGDTPTITAIYLDTLARCNFAIGNLDKAIQLQSQALVRMPHERQMQRQLAEFQAAKQKREASGTKEKP
jgi:tetratricopeptide (TPR) repeat protein